MIRSLLGTARYYIWPLLFLLALVVDVAAWLQAFGQNAIGSLLAVAALRFAFAMLLQQMFVQAGLATRTHYISFTFILLSGWLVPWHGLHEGLAYQAFFLLVLYYFLSMSKYSPRHDNLFFCGFFLGLTAVFNLSATLVLAALMGIMVLYGYSLRHLLLMLLAFLLPAYFYGVAEYVVNGEITFHHRTLQEMQAFDFSLSYRSAYHAIVAVLLGAMLAASRLAWQRTEVFRLLKKRQAVNLLVFLSFWLIVIVFAPLGQTEDNLAVAVIPCSFVMARMLEERFPGWLHWLWMALLVAPVVVSNYKFAHPDLLEAMHFFF